MFTKLWGRITGADKKKALPDQQASVLGRLGDYIVVYPYGSYCDLPDDIWLRVIDEGVVIPVTSIRLDTERGEPIFYHPVTGAKVHFKNNGDIDVESPSDVNVTCVNANIAASADVNVSCVNADVNCTTKAIVTAPAIELNGNVTINGNLSATGTISGAGVTDTTTNVTLGTHTHNGGTVPAPDPGS